MTQNGQPISPEFDRKYFKYVTRNTGKIVLENRTLRWSSPFMYNDPYDNQFNLHLDVDPAAVKSQVLDALWRQYSGEVAVNEGTLVGRMMRLLRTAPMQVSRDEFVAIFAPTIDEGLVRGERYLPDFQRELAELARRHKVLCLGLTATSLLMWAYYAEGHAGLVLCFRCVQGLDSPWSVGRRVEYSREMPRLLDTEGLANVMSGRASLAQADSLNRLVFTKSHAWSHEQEWRIFSGLGRYPDAMFEDIKFNALELEGVIFGCKMQQDDRVAITDLLGRCYPHTRRMQASLLDREYGLKIEELNS